MVRRLRFGFAASIALFAALAAPEIGWSLPAAGPLNFASPTPIAGAVVTASSVTVRLDAECSIDTGTLAVSYNGSAISSAAFLPFGPCANGRMLSQEVAVPISRPNTTLTAAPSTIDAGDAPTFSATGSGDRVRWRFGGAAAPAEGASVNPTIEPAGVFTVTARATTDGALLASAFDGGNLVNTTRDFEAGDPTPDTATLTSVMPPFVDFENWESGHVHPIALSESGAQVFAVNTPEGLLAIFDVNPDGSLSHAADVPVGLDPVSLAQRPGTDEVWVVNHHSDNVTIVDAATATVIDSVEPGDEPTDVVFASGRAFVSVSGQNDRVVVYNGSTRAELTSIDIFGDDPRALAASGDGTEVYLVVFESGNQSTVLFHELVSDNGGPPPPSPARTAPGSAPDVGLIVQLDPNDGQWKDDAGNNWSSYVDFSMPDQDVFVIDADAGTPSVVSTVSSVGTTLFDVAVRPGTNQLFVPNTDARNVVRFEPNLRGELVETRISVVTTGGGGSSTAFDVNPHINYAVTPGPPSEIAQSLAHPGDGAFSADGNTYYLTSLGTEKVAVIDVLGQAITARIDVGGGPSGVALNEADNRLYVMNRFENTISVVNTGTNSEIERVGVTGASAFDPSPDVVKAGRKFLYDGQLTSGHGDIACATCHPFGNFDNLAWDLGDPTGDFVDYDDAPWVQFFAAGNSEPGFDPMKGPMTTQTLRGLLDMEPFHWRGDRENFQHFNGAFVGLMGRDTELSAADMDAYTEFIMTLRYPANPYRNVDDTMPNSIAVPNQTGSGSVNGNPNTGRNLFLQSGIDGPFSCNDCHSLPTGTNNDLFNGNLEGESQDLKIPQMRNMYEKVGFDPIRPGILGGNANNIAATSMKAGFGFLHDGSISLTEFLAASVFGLGTQAERDMFAFSIAFPTETPASVGVQVDVSIANRNSGSVVSAINTLVGEAEAGACDLIVRGDVGGNSRGWVYDPATNTFLPDSVIEAPVTDAQLRASLSGSDHVSYTGVPDGAGRRMGIDRDRDTWPNWTETALGSDPADPTSNPWQ